MMKLDYVPSVVEWIYQKAVAKPIVAWYVSLTKFHTFLSVLMLALFSGSKDDNIIRLFDASNLEKDAQGKAVPVAVLDKLHRAPVSLMKVR